MERIIVMAVCAVIALCAVIYLVKFLVLKFTGIETEAEVVAVKEHKQGSYIHTLKFSLNGKTIEKDDRTGYSQPFSKGDTVKIICSKKDTGKFEYADALRKNIIVTLILIIMALLTVIRFAFTVAE